MEACCNGAQLSATAVSADPAGGRLRRALSSERRMVCFRFDDTSARLRRAFAPCLGYVVGLYSTSQRPDGALSSSETPLLVDGYPAVFKLSR